MLPVTSALLISSIMGKKKAKPDFDDSPDPNAPNAPVAEVKEEETEEKAAADTKAPSAAKKKDKKKDKKVIDRSLACLMHAYVISRTFRSASRIFL